MWCRGASGARHHGEGRVFQLVELAVRNALAIGAGHAFIVFLREGYPVNVLNQVKQVPEVCRIYCATANQVEVVVGVTGTGRAILGVVDGVSPAGVETDADAAERHQLLRRIGYVDERQARSRRRHDARQGRRGRAPAFCREFFAPYNHQHRHSGIGLLTPATVHHGQAEQTHAARRRVLAAAYAAWPERFVRRPPRPPALPTGAWINKPNTEQVAH
jgi:Adenosine specific kinase